MKSYQIAVVGGGPAGMMAAIRSAQLLNKFEESRARNKHDPEFSNKSKVILIEKNADLGKKLLLTGGGRCNITNTSSIKDTLRIFGKNSSFLKHSFYNLDSTALLDFFKVKALNFKVEKEGKVYPKDDKAISVLNILKTYLEEQNIELKVNTNVNTIQLKQNMFQIGLDPITKRNDLNKDVKAERTKKQKEIIKSSKLILATGGISYPSTGSNGKGLKLAQDLGHNGHNITPLRAGLVPVKVEEKWIKELSGLKLENIGLSYKSSKKKITSQGTILLTHFGLSGPGILDISREISLTLENLKTTESIELNLDLIITKSPEELKNQFNHDFQEKGKTLIKNYLKLVLPNNMIMPFLEQIQINPLQKLNQIPKKEKNQLIDSLKNLKVHITDTLPIEKAMITCGGINHKSINSKSMESKELSGLYFAGEIIDFCGPSGGYNLQLAFSTGYTAGENAARSLMKN